MNRGTHTIIIISAVLYVFVLLLLLALGEGCGRTPFGHTGQVGVWVEQTGHMADAGIDTGRVADDAGCLTSDAYAGGEDVEVAIADDAGSRDADGATDLPEDAEVKEDVEIICHDGDRQLMEDFGKQVLEACWYSCSCVTKCLFLHGLSWNCAEHMAGFVNCAIDECLAPCAAGEIEECMECRAACAKDFEKASGIPVGFSLE